MPEIKDDFTFDFKESIVSEWVGFNSTSTKFRSFAPSLTRKTGTESPTVKDKGEPTLYKSCRRYIILHSPTTASPFNSALAPKGCGVARPIYNLHQRVNIMDSEELTNGKLGYIGRDSSFSLLCSGLSIYLQLPDEVTTNRFIWSKIIAS